MVGIELEEVAKLVTQLIDPAHGLDVVLEVALHRLKHLIESLKEKIDSFAFFEPSEFIGGRHLRTWLRTKNRLVVVLIRDHGVLGDIRLHVVGLQARTGQHITVTACQLIKFTILATCLTRLHRSSILVHRVIALVDRILINSFLLPTFHTKSKLLVTSAYSRIQRSRHLNMWLPVPLGHIQQLAQRWRLPRSQWRGRRHHRENVRLYFPGTLLLLLTAQISHNYFVRFYH